MELLPVVNEKNELLGVIGRQDVIKSLQVMHKQPEIGETLHELSYRGFKEVVNEEGVFVFCGKVTPQMTDSLGTLGVGVLTSLMTETASRLLRRLQHGDLTVQEFTLYVLKLIQLDSKITVIPRVLEMGRKQAKLEIEVKNGSTNRSKSLVDCHINQRVLISLLGMVFFGAFEIFESVIQIDEADDINEANQYISEGIGT